MLEQLISLVPRNFLRTCRSVKWYEWRSCLWTFISKMTWLSLFNVCEAQYLKEQFRQCRCKKTVALVNGSDYIGCIHSVYPWLSCCVSLSVCQSLSLLLSHQYLLCCISNAWWANLWPMYIFLCLHVTQSSYGSVIKTSISFSLWT